MGLSDRKRRLCSQRGVSLVEVMMATGVFVIVVLGLVDLFYLGRAHIVEMGLRRGGLALAQQKLEELRAADFSDGDLTIGDHGPESVWLSENLKGNRTWSVAWNDDPANGISYSDQDYKEVVVRVAWTWELTHQDTISLRGRFYP